MDWYIGVLKKYTVFSGRARRKEYWFFVLINTLISIMLGFVDGYLGFYDPSVGIGMLSGVYALAVLLPSLAVAVRRLHDTGRTGWWMLIIVLPLIGPIVLLVFFVFDSQPEANEYGESPKNDNTLVSEQSF